MFEYKMIPLSPVVTASKKNMRDAAADYLEREVNKMAKDGWEFIRIDTFHTEEAQGCLSFGKKESIIHYVASFKRSKNA